MAAHPLPAAPVEVPGPDGLPQFGSYQGELGVVDLGRLTQPHRFPSWARRLRGKRWHYALYTTPELIAVMAVAELGYASNAFFAALDLREKHPLVDVTLLGPPAPLTVVSNEMSRGLSARFRLPGASFQFARGSSEDRYRHTVELSALRHPRLGRVRFQGEALVTGASPPLVLVAPVADGGSGGGALSSFLPRHGVNVTQKSVGLLAAGRLEVGRWTYSLDGGVVGLDSSQGFLARHTRWRWAMGAGRLEDGTPIGFNLVDGFNEPAAGPGENVLFLGDQLQPVGPAEFRFNSADPLDLWQLSTADGAVALTFRPLHTHRDVRDLLLLRSRFVQPLGFFTGTLRFRGQTLTLTDLPGVTEDQDMLW
jgi:hypothetical protein